MTLHHVLVFVYWIAAALCLTGALYIVLTHIPMYKPERPRHRIHTDVAELAALEPDETWADDLAAMHDAAVPPHEPPARAPLLTNGGWTGLIQAPGYTINTLNDLPSQAAGTGPQAAATALASTARSNRGGAVPVSLAGEPGVTGPAAGLPPLAAATVTAGPATHPDDTDYGDVLPSYVIDALRTAQPADTVTSNTTLKPWLRELLSCPADQIEAAAAKYNAVLDRIAEHDRQLHAGIQARSLMIVQGR